MYVNPMKTSKVSSLVCFYLVSGVKVIGTLHLPPNTRMTETMNMHYNQKPFVPLTGVKIIEPSGQEKTQSFMVINKNHIIFGFPVAKAEPQKKEVPPWAAAGGSETKH